MLKDLNITVATVASRLHVAASTYTAIFPMREVHVWKEERIHENTNS